MEPDVIQDGVPIRFVHVDDAVLVLDKPAGLLSVPGRGPDKQDCLSARVHAQYADALVALLFRHPEFLSTAMDVASGPEPS